VQLRQGYAGLSVREELVLLVLRLLPLVFDDICVHLEACVRVCVYVCMCVYVQGALYVYISCQTMEFSLPSYRARGRADAHALCMCVRGRAVRGASDTSPRLFQRPSSHSSSSSSAMLTRAPHTASRAGLK